MGSTGGATGGTTGALGIVVVAVVGVVAGEPPVTDNCCLKGSFATNRSSVPRWPSAVAGPRSLLTRPLADPVVGAGAEPERVGGIREPPGGAVPVFGSVEAVVVVVVAADLDGLISFIVFGIS
jgi:hypothetical protein